MLHLIIVPQHQQLTDDAGNLTFRLQSVDFQKKPEEFIRAIQQGEAMHVGSWRKVQGKLGQLLRLKILTTPAKGVSSWITRI
jgi:hypothetical protein